MLHCRQLLLLKPLGNSTSSLLFLHLHTLALHQLEFLHKIRKLSAFVTDHTHVLPLLLDIFKSTVTLSFHRGDDQSEHTSSSAGPTRNPSKPPTTATPKQNSTPPTSGSNIQPPSSILLARGVSQDSSRAHNKKGKKVDTPSTPVNNPHSLPILMISYFP